MSSNKRDLGLFAADIAKVKAFFEEIPKSLANQVGPIVDAMLVPHERAMRRELLQHQRTGLLRQSIRRKVTLYDLNQSAFGIVGPSREVFGRYQGKKVVPANYAHLLNYGTKPHLLGKEDTGRRESFLVEPRGRRAYYRERKIYRRFGREHPGAKPFPFRERAYESAKEESLRIGRVALARAINGVIPPPRIAA